MPPDILFLKVPEPKTVKNPMHFDLRAPGTVADEVHRLEALGATVVQPLDCRAPRRTYHYE